MCCFVVIGIFDLPIILVTPCLALGARLVVRNLPLKFSIPFINSILSILVSEWDEEGISRVIERRLGHKPDSNHELFFSSSESIILFGSFLKALGATINPLL